MAWWDKLNASSSEITGQKTATPSQPYPVVLINYRVPTPKRSGVDGLRKRGKLNYDKKLKLSN